MRRLLLAGLILCAALAPLESHAVGTKKVALLTAAQANDADGNPVVTASYTTGVIQVCCVFDATINIEWSVDGENYEPLECISVADRNNRGTSMIARGGMRCNLIGLNHLRLTITNYISGTIDATIGLASAGVY